MDTRQKIEISFNAYIKLLNRGGWWQLAPLKTTRMMALWRTMLTQLSHPLLLKAAVKNVSFHQFHFLL